MASVRNSFDRLGVDSLISNEVPDILRASHLVLPGVGAFKASMEKILKNLPVEVIREQLQFGKPLLGICVGMQVLFEKSTEHAETGFHAGLNEWPGTVDQLTAPVLPHMGWNNVSCAPQSQMFTGIADERFYFVHSYAARNWELDPHEKLAAPKVSWSNHGENFVAAVENGPLWATQFHPEKSGDAGLTLLANWIAAIK